MSKLGGFLESSNIQSKESYVLLLVWDEMNFQYEIEWTPNMRINIYSTYIDVWAREIVKSGRRITKKGDQQENLTLRVASSRSLSLKSLIEQYDRLLSSWKISCM